MTSNIATTIRTSTNLKSQTHDNDNDTFNNDNGSSTNSNSMTRRSMIWNQITKAASTTAILSTVSTIVPTTANAMVGSLPEFEDSNAVLQGVTVDVSDLGQQNTMIDFLTDGFQMKLLRQRKVGSVTETWMGYGPEEMKIPDIFEMSVSSFNQYGGHASICIRYDSQTMDLYYRQGSSDDGTSKSSSNNIAYVQVGVPEYRISQMVKNGGNILDAYGIVNVISPSGLPMRGIVGISPDPIMFVALNCLNVRESRDFYAQLGFVEQEYPFCRPNKGMGQFEPPQPKNSIYMAPSRNAMGVLLLQTDRKKKTVKPNPAFRSMNIVYTPSADTDTDASDLLKVVDPSGAGISFQPYGLFEKVELSTRVVAQEEV